MNSKKLLWFVAFLCLMAVTFVLLRDKLSLPYLAAREEAMRAQLKEHPLLVYSSAFALYVLVTGLSLPGATLMTLVFAWYFGFWRALVLVSFASTSGATCAFWLSRYFLQDVVRHRFGERMKRITSAFEQEGAFYLFSLRLIPAVPFFVINVVMGVTHIGAWTYWWVSQLGMLPGTAVYVYAGQSLPSLRELESRETAILTPQLIFALTLLGMFPLLTRLIVKRWKPSRPARRDRASR